MSKKVIRISVYTTDQSLKNYADKQSNKMSVSTSEWVRLMIEQHREKFSQKNTK